MNPIEEAFSKIKALVRKVGARVREALVEAIGQALAAVTREDAAGWFAHAGYWPQEDEVRVVRHGEARVIVEHPLKQRRPRPRTPHDEEERVGIFRYALRGLYRSEGSSFGHA